MKSALIGLFMVVVAVFSLSIHRLSQTMNPVVLAVPENYFARVNHPDDGFTVAFLIDDDHADLVHKDKITRLRLTGETDSVGVRLLEPPQNKARSDIGAYVQIELYLGVEDMLQNTVRTFEPARLSITTVGGTIIEVPLGSVTLLCGVQSDPVLDFTRVDNLPGRVGYGVTSLGAVIALINPRDYLVKIERIHLGGAPISIDVERMVINDDTPQPFADVESLINSGSSVTLPLELQPGDEMRLTLPFDYPSPKWLLYRYPLIFETDAGVFVLEPFRYINTDRFHEENRVLFEEGRILD